METKPIIFLDIDGVLNSEFFYRKKQELGVKEKTFKDKIKFYGQMLDPLAVKLIDTLVEEVNADIVLSSTWRKHFTVEEFNKCISLVGGQFKIIDKTGYNDSRIRGVEIYQWLEKNIEDSDFDWYVILDDDSDMLLSQRNNFFHVDGYYGLTPNICYKVKRFLLKNKLSKKIICG